MLRCSPTESEAHLPFLALIDALGPVADEVSHALPPSQRAVLDAALTGRRGAAEHGDGLALRLAVLSVFRALAAQGPVLLVADDLQWMDAPSAELLAFAARRLGELPVRVIAAVRTETPGEGPSGGGSDDVERHLRMLPPPARALPVPPLTPAQTSELLARRRRAGAAGALPGAVLREVHRTSGGNPLFALELDRALTELGTTPRPGDPLPVPTSLRTLVLHRLRALPPRVRTTLLIASAGARPTLALLWKAGRTEAEADIARAAALGIADIEHDYGRIEPPGPGAPFNPIATRPRAGHTSGSGATTVPAALAGPAVPSAPLPRGSAVGSSDGATAADLQGASYGHATAPAYDHEAPSGDGLPDQDGLPRGDGLPDRNGLPREDGLPDGDGGGKHAYEPAPPQPSGAGADRLRGAEGAHGADRAHSAEGAHRTAHVRSADRAHGTAGAHTTSGVHGVDDPDDAHGACCRHEHAQGAMDDADAGDGGGPRGGHDTTVRFAHPLISAALYAEATPLERRAAHAALARASADPIESARHLALATPERDARVACTLARAAAVARERGAPATAAGLGLLAAERTPEHEPRTAVGRRLEAAEDALMAGEPELARRTAYEVLAATAHPADRVRAWIVVIDSVGQAMADVDDVFPQALADAGDDPRLLALVRYQLSWRAMLVLGSLSQARAEAAGAAALAAVAGDRRTELLALSFQALNETLMGHQDAEDTLSAALAEPQDPRVACDHNGPGYTHFRCLLMGDRLDEARATIKGLVALAEQRGAVEGQMLFLRGLAEAELRAGRCGDALELAHRSLRLARDAGMGEGPVLQLTALAEAAGGSVPRALALARDAVHSAEEDGDLLYLARNLYALGHARLTGGDAEGAVSPLRRVRDMERGQGVTDPARGRWQGDLAEALVRVGELAEAREVIADTRASALRLRRRGVLAVLDRAEALVQAAEGDLNGAACALRSAARTLRALGYRVEEGRAELALGQVELSRGDLRAGREALEAAARVFRRAKARPWLEQATTYLTALEAAPSAPPGETPSGECPASGGLLEGLAEMERRVAGLVLEGATNREIAARLFISVKTVEATLTRVYRKLGIRSRVDIVRLASRGS
ncbi:LuxR C-terminal-related transcriptional regulator [Streptomyces sp. LX-29]|uniref:LuxR family transcriptional regulator n=1 Tax=Streptomyces sp. LX-29 TaxID=2900152 RepID=UPI00240D6206|nr:LuxR family transcriptional regulator [Streptomyces sp. LX-29]WFB11825.1 LuxR C-terminal-related transcriptional regulator [Streptomyces sp. LX-29]